MFIMENVCSWKPVIASGEPVQTRLNNRGFSYRRCVLLLAGSLYRFNTFLVGFSPGPGWTYFPALPEILITVGIVALELMGYLYFVKRYPVLPKVEHA